MLTGKVYDLLKDQLDRFLFGFDKSQMSMSLLKGSISLSNVNLRPEEINSLLNGTPEQR